MAEIKVSVFKKGQEITQMMRPLRYVEGKPVVKYRKKFWPLINGGQIHLDDVSSTNHLHIQKVAKNDENIPEAEFQMVPATFIEWDESQREVIEAPQEDRLLVGAGPGTGKTAVACARVSQLINQDGLEPSRIWLISFTRTAVHEIRNRIATFLEDASAAYAVKIATLDSYAWTIHSGFDDTANVLGTYEMNIRQVLKLVQSDEGVAEYLESIEHLVIDEAQDIVGIRSDLIIEITRKLSSSCGVTVFTDEAQAIYGFADNREIQIGEIGEPSFSERVRRGAAGTFQEYELTDVHRTSSQRLLTIFSDTRRKVLSVTGEAADKLAEIKSDIMSLAHGEAPRGDDPALAELEDAFILYRRRCDVLLTSSLLKYKGISHRVRMSGLPVYLTPWIGAALSEHTESDLNKSRFEELWFSKVNGTHFATCNVDFAWASLVRLAGHTQTLVNMRLLRQRLGRKRPPVELCHPELGLHGPIIGTIHASKGREAEIVHLMLPETHSQNVDQDEEARVMFVGATRGRSRLLIGRGYRQYAHQVADSGRAYSLKTRGNRPRAQIEFGRDTDIGAEGLAGRLFFPTADEVRSSQTRMRDFADETIQLVAKCDRASNFAYRLREEGQERCLAVLSPCVNADLFTVANAVQTKLGGGRLRPPDKIPYLHVHGVCSIVLPPDSLESEKLHEPWRSSGIVLTPLILGYSTVSFHYRYNGWR